MQDINDESTHDEVSSPVLGRRQLLRSASALGVLGLAGVAEGRSKAIGRRCRLDGERLRLAEEEVLSSMCELTPSSIQGPFYLDLDLLRVDITEGKPGLPTRLVLRVVRALDCSPIPNAVVDVWHCDADGAYSGFPSRGTAGETWLRGIQFTDQFGSAHFDTIYPGWYQGRTTHIHLKVRPNAQSELTTQLYFEDDASARVYLLRHYAAHGPKPVDNDEDGFFLPETVLNLRSHPTTEGVLVGLTIGIA